MALRKDKKKVVGEHFDEDRIKSFLEYEPYGDRSPSYHLLEKAYRGMKADNFATFVRLFVDAGYDVNATNSDGKTFLQEISEHRHAEDYVDALKAAGAR
jgi:ankyrin repeat protein